MSIISTIHHQPSKMAEKWKAWRPVSGIFLRRSSISSEKVWFQVQVMKRKREKLTILKEVSLYL